MSNSKEFQPMALVRRYSQKLEDDIERQGPNAPVLSLAVVEEVKRQDKREQEKANAQESFEPSRERSFELLEKNREALEAAWNKFLKTLPESARAQLARRPKTYEEVLKAVETARVEWERKTQKGKLGKAKNYFHSCCQTLDAHSTMLQILPASSHYVSVFYGSLHAMIEGSVNHHKVAEGLPRILSEINDVVAAARKEVSIYPTEIVQNFIAQLYARILLLFAVIMDWCTKNSKYRLWKCLKKDCYQEFEKELLEIRNISFSIFRDTQASQSQQIGDAVRISLDTYEHVSRIPRLLEKYGRERDEEYRKLAMEKEREVRRGLDEGKMIALLQDFGQKLYQDLRREVLGVAATELLKQNARASSPEEIKQTRSLEPRVFEASCTDKEILGSGDAQSGHEARFSQTREDVQLRSQKLDEWYHESQVIIDPQVLGAFFVEDQVITALQDWTTKPKSQILCFQGPYQTGLQSASTSIAAQYISLSTRIELPVISFFCSLPRGNLPSGSIPETVALVAMISSLIRQLLMFLPTMLSNDAPDFGSQRFDQLDGTLDTWQQMLDIFEDLLKLSPPLLICVIDGFQWLDNEHTAERLKSFLSVVREHTNRENQDLKQGSSQPSPRKIFKVLFTTAGQSRVLVPELTRGEHLISNLPVTGQTPKFKCIPHLAFYST